MNSARPTIFSVLLTFVAAAMFYFLAYSWLSRKQVGKGPWHVTFTNDASGVPGLVIGQVSLGLSNVWVRFADEKLSATQRTGTVAFNRPRLDPPFGELVYDDLMFLPGTVTLDCFGHEVELLPRVLVLDRKEVRWASDTTNVLVAASKLPPEARRNKKAGYRR